MAHRAPDPSPQDQRKIVRRPSTAVSRTVTIWLSVAAAAVAAGIIAVVTMAILISPNTSEDNNSPTVTTEQQMHNAFAICDESQRLGVAPIVTQTAMTIAITETNLNNYASAHSEYSQSLDHVGVNDISGVNVGMYLHRADTNEQIAMWMDPNRASAETLRVIQDHSKSEPTASVDRLAFLTQKSAFPRSYTKNVREGVALTAKYCG